MSLDKDDYVMISRTDGKTVVVSADKWRYRKDIRPDIKTWHIIGYRQGEWGHVFTWSRDPFDGIGRARKDNNRFSFGYESFMAIPMPVHHKEDNT